MALSNAERSRRYDERNREKRRLAAAARRAANPARTKEIKRKAYVNNADSARAYAARWRAENPEAVKRHDALRDKDKQRARARAWKAANPDKCRQHQENRRASVEARLSNRVRVRIHAVLRGSAGRSRTLSRLGYTATELRSHLERQFLRGMTWDNMGEWHIDHIVPLSSFTFDSVDDPEFRRAWALTNLRPLWGVDNLRKSDKRTHLL